MADTVDAFWSTTFPNVLAFVSMIAAIVQAVAAVQSRHAEGVGLASRAVRWAVLALGLMGFGGACIVGVVLALGGDGLQAAQLVALIGSGVVGLGVVVASGWLFREEPDQVAGEELHRLVRRLVVMLDRQDDEEKWDDSWFAELEAEVQEVRQPRRWRLPVSRRTKWREHAEPSLTRFMERWRGRLLVLQGPPGSGKSVALRHLAERLCDRALTLEQPDTIPIYIDLKTLRPRHRSESSIDGDQGPPDQGKEPVDANLIRRFVLEQLGSGNQEVRRALATSFDRGMKAGTWLFLFDSFDEIPEVLHAITMDAIVQSYRHAIEDFAAFSNCRVMLATRDLRGHHDPGWAVVGIKGLSPTRKRSLIKLRGVPERLADELAGRLGHDLAPPDPSIRQLSSNPLFLSLLCEHLKAGHRFPRSAHEVFETAVASRYRLDPAAPDDPGMSAVPPVVIRRVAEEIAFCMAVDPGLDLSPSRASLLQAMQRLGFGQSLQDAQAVMDELQRRKLARRRDPAGVAGARGPTRTFAFTHHRFQEYFATCFVLREPERVGARTLLTDWRWRETAITICQLQLPDRVELLLDAAQVLLEEAASDIPLLVESLEPPADPLQVWTRTDNQFGWPPIALHVLELLDTGFASRPEALPTPMREIAGRLMVTASTYGTIRDRKWALEVAGTGPHEVLLRLLDQAVQGRSAWLRGIALSQVARLRQIPASIKQQIGRNLCLRWVEGSLKAQRSIVRAELQRLPEPEPANLLRSLELLGVSTPIDFALHLLLALVVVIRPGSFGPRLQLTSKTVVTAVAALLLSHFCLYSYRLGIRIFSRASTQMRNGFSVSGWVLFLILIRGFLLIFVLAAIPPSIPPAVFVLSGAYALSWAPAACASAALGRFVERRWWLLPQVGLVAFAVDSWRGADATKWDAVGISAIVAAVVAGGIINAALSGDEGIWRAPAWPDQSQPEQLDRTIVAYGVAGFAFGSFYLLLNMLFNELSQIRAVFRTSRGWSVWRLTVAGVVVIIVGSIVGSALFRVFVQPVVGWKLPDPVLGLLPGLGTALTLVEGLFFLLALVGLVASLIYVVRPTYSDRRRRRRDGWRLRDWIRAWEAHHPEWNEGEPPPKTHDTWPSGDEVLSRALSFETESGFLRFLDDLRDKRVPHTSPMVRAALQDLALATDLAAARRVQDPTVHLTPERQPRPSFSTEEIDRQLGAYLDTDNYWQLTRSEDALDQLGRLLDKATPVLTATDLPADQQAKLLVEQAMFHFRSNDHVDALANLERALVQRPNDPEAHGLRGVVLLVGGRYEEALASLDRSTQLSEDPWMLVKRGLTKRLLARYEEALADLDQALSLSPNFITGLIERGLVYRALERDAESLADLDQAMELNPADVRVLVERARTYNQMGRYQNAAADLDQAIALEAENTNAWAERGRVHRLLGQHEEAVADLDHVLERHPSSAWALTERGLTKGLLARYEEALADLDRAVSLDPDLAWTRVIRGRIFNALRRFEDALSDFARAIELDTDDVEALIERGKTYRSMDRFQDALTDFDRAIELDADDVDALIDRGITRSMDGQPQGASDDLDRAIKLAPGSATVLNGRGVVYRLVGRYAEALADFDRAIELRPDYAWALAGRGVVYRLVGRYAEALADFDRAIELRPDYAWALANRGETRRLTGQFRAAVTDLDRALELQPDNALALANRGATRRRLGELQAARADLDQAIEKASNDDWIHCLAAQVHLQQGAVTSARALLAKAVEQCEAKQARAPMPLRVVHLALYHTALDDPLAYERWKAMPAVCTTWETLRQHALTDLDELRTAVPNPRPIDRIIRLLSA
jgi:tetratricopeptide (TPR) repeat protein